VLLCFINNCISKQLYLNKYLLYLFCSLKKMSLVFNFPQDLITELFTDWFESPAVTFFDSALCNKEIRPSLLNLFASSLYLHKGCDGYCFSYLHENRWHSFNQWIILRKINIMSTTLGSTDILSGEFETLLTNKKLQELILNLDRGLKNSKIGDAVKKSALKRISMTCSELRKLEVSFCRLGTGDESDLITFISRNISLESVQFNCNRYLGNATLQAISNSCVNIQVVHLHKCADTIDLSSIICMLKTCKLLEFMTVTTSRNDDRMFRFRIIDTEKNVKRTSVRLTGFDEASEMDKHALMGSLYCVYVLWLKGFTLTNACMKLLVSFKELNFLTLDECGHLFSSIDLVELVSNCNKLNKIHLSDCCHLSNDDLFDILTVKGNVLTVIGISRHMINFSTLCKIVSANKSLLAQLYLSDCIMLRMFDLIWSEELQLHNANLQICRKVVIETL
jgi:hypothetical protein